MKQCKHAPQTKIGDMTCLCQWGADAWNKQWAVEWWAEAFCPGIRWLE